jgi:hypothetical protein
MFIVDSPFSVHHGSPMGVKSTAQVDDGLPVDLTNAGLGYAKDCADFFEGQAFVIV